MHEMGITRSYKCQTVWSVSTRKVLITRRKRNLWGIKELGMFVMFISAECWYNAAVKASFVGNIGCVRERTTPKQINCGWETLELNVFNEFILTGVWQFVEEKIDYFWRETGSVTTGWCVGAEEETVTQYSKHTDNHGTRFSVHSSSFLCPHLNSSCQLIKEWVSIK